MIENLTTCFDGLIAPRMTFRCNHRLIDILMIAAIACAESWEDIELNQRKMRIGMSICGHGYQSAAWRHPGVPADSTL